MRDANYTETIEFLTAFFRDTSEAVELRALPNGSGTPKVEFTRNPLRVTAFCQHYDRLGSGVYFGVATRDEAGRGGKREHCRELPAAWTEIDLEKFGMSVEVAVGILLACPLPPSVIVFSGHGLHVYWLLAAPLSVTYAPFGEDAEKARVERVTRSFVRIFRGDPNAVDLTRVLRLPGTHNTKEGTLLPCRVLEASWTRYELEQVEAFAALSPVLIAAEDAPASEPAANLPPDDPYAAYGTNWREPFDMGRLDLMSYQDADNPIHQTRLKAAASMVQRGELDDDAIFERLLAATHRAAGLAGERWDWRREEAAIQREIASAHKKWPPPSPKVVQLRPGQQEQADKEPKPAGEVAPEFMGFPLNDLGNAMRLLTLHRDMMKYCVNIGWHLWDKRRYAHDPENIRTARLAHQTVRQMVLAAFGLPRGEEAQAKTRKAAITFANQSGNRNRIDGMLSVARSHADITVDQLDSDTMLLNCRNGTLDLRTGELRPHAQADLLTKMCGTNYDPEAACPRWEQFISEIFDGNQDLIAFVQRALGYSLTGDTREEVVFILHGSGANGKTKLIETMAAVMGDYVRHSPADAWTATPGPQPSYDLAALVGARFVPVVETERGRQLAEARIKQATGGDKISAMHKYKDPFEYQPQFKLWFATNHKPKIKGSDHAIWRRVYLIPFLVKFVDKAEADDEGGRRIKDPEIITKLLLEKSGILAWMVRGCLEWQRLKSLNPPEAVKAATRDYQDSEDNISGFINERCNVRRSLSDPFGLLYAGYLLWCEASEEEAQSRRAFGLSLSDRGHSIDRANRERKRKGIDLQSTFREEAAQRAEEEKALSPISGKNAEE